MKLTAGNIRTLQITNGKAEQTYFCEDRPGFGLRLRSTGGRTLIFQYGRQGGGNKTPKIKIGAVGAIDFSEAVKTYKNYYAQVQLGQDPARARATAKASASQTFEAKATLFLARQRLRLRPRSYPEVERHLLRDSKPLHKLGLSAISRRDIAGVVSEVSQKRGLVTANRVRSSLSTFFAWAVGEGLLDQNVVVGTNKHDETPRDRVLTPDELRLIWTHAGAEDYGTILRLLALTGARANEITGLCWSEVRNDIIVLAANRVKGARPHEIPLSRPARELIEAQPRRTTADGRPRDLIFGIGEGPFQGWTNCKAKLVARITKATGEALPHFTPHDLRRSFSTHANELGIAPPHIIEAILGHVSAFTRIARVYNLASYQNEKRIALDKWAEWLIATVQSRESKVTALRRPA